MKIKHIEYITWIATHMIEAIHSLSFVHEIKPISLLLFFFSSQQKSLEQQSVQEILHSCILALKTLCSFEFMMVDQP